MNYIISYLYTSEEKNEDGKPYIEYVALTKDGKFTLLTSKFEQDFDGGFERLGDLLSYHGIQMKYLKWQH